MVLPDGRGTSAPTTCPQLEPGRGYQLWALVGPNPVSIGLLGPDPEQSAFRATGPVSGFAITNELGGGRVRPRARIRWWSGLVHQELTRRAGQLRWSSRSSR